jgi:hypothetical protein
MRNVLLLIILLFVATPAFGQRLLNKDVDSIEVWANTAKDGSGTSYIPLSDADGHLQVDVLSGGGSSAQFAEDTAHVTADNGAMSLAVRNDGGSSLCDTDGDYCPFSLDANGSLRVTGGGGGTEYTEGNTDTTITGGAVLAEGPSDTLTPLQVDASKNLQVAIATDSAGLCLDTSVDGVEGLLTTISGNQLADSHNVTIDNAAGVSAVNIQDGGNAITVDGTVTANAGTGPWPVTDNAGSLTVDGTVAATQSGTWTINNLSGTVSLPTGASTAANQTTLIGRLPATATAADNTTNPSISKLGSYNFVYDGSTWDRAPGTSTDGLLVNLGTNNDVTVSGTVTSNLGTLNGAATAANQLPDGHNVTIDNASGASAVNIQDGGNTITVDGTITANLAAGTNNIGDVDVATQPARDNATDTITVSLDTAAIMNDTTALTPKFAVIDEATSGDNTVVAAVASKKIRVLSLFMICAGDVDARFESGAAGTALSGQMDMTANSGFVLPFNPVGWFETGTNTLLNLELSAAVSCDGSVVYVEV